MIQGHPGGSWRSEGGVRDKDGAGPLIVTCLLYRLSTLANPSWDFRKSLLKWRLLCHTQERNILSFWLAYQSQKTRTRSLCVVIPPHTRDRHFLQASTKAPAPFKSTALLFASIALFCGSPLLPGVAASSQWTSCSPPEWNPFRPGQSTWGTGRAAVYIQQSCIWTHALVLFPVRIFFCTAVL